MSVAVLASTLNMPRKEWLTLRRNGIGGSDVAAILGLDTYNSPYSVWADKLGLLPEKEDTEAMRQGRDLEDYVAKRFCEETGKKVRRKNIMFKSEAYPFMMANIDREVVGETAGVECKTTSIMNLKKFKNGEYPATYYCQCMHYLAVTGWQKWYLAVLILNQGFHLFEIERDEDEIAALVNAESEFWELVKSKTPPLVDGAHSTSQALDAIAGAFDGNEIDLPDVKMDLLQLESINSQVRILAKDAERIRQKLKSRMGSTGKGYCEEYEIIWSNHHRAYIDKASLLKYCPKDVISKIVKVRPYKSFRIRKGE